MHFAYGILFFDHPSLAAGKHLLRRVVHGENAWNKGLDIPRTIDAYR